MLSQDISFQFITSINIYYSLHKQLCIKCKCKHNSYKSLENVIMNCLGELLRLH